MEYRTKNASSKITKQGFSLLELLIYVVILSGLMVVIANAFMSLSKGRGQSEARSEVNASIRFANERLKQDLKNASSLTTPILGTASSTLEMVIPGFTIKYDTLAGQLRRTEGTGLATTTTAVTGPGIFVDTPTFTRFENYSTSLNATTTAVKISAVFHYNASSTDWMYQSALQTTISLR